MEAIIRISGDWCNGYWWEIVSSATGRVIKECGPYHTFRMSDAARVAREDAADYASRNEIKIIR